MNRNHIDGRNISVFSSFLSRQLLIDLAASLNARENRSLAYPRGLGKPLAQFSFEYFDNATAALFAEAVVTIEALATLADRSPLAAAICDGIIGVSGKQICFAADLLAPRLVALEVLMAKQSAAADSAVAAGKFTREAADAKLLEIRASQTASIRCGNDAHAIIERLKT